MRHIVSQHVDVYLVDFGNDINFTNENGRLEQHIKSVITPIIEMTNARIDRQQVTALVTGGLS